VQAFQANGILYERATKSKSEVYLEAQPFWNRVLISIPGIPRLLRELRLLERRTHRSGRDTIDHGTNGTDDYANALCGACWLVQRPEEPAWYIGSGWGGKVRRIDGKDDDAIASPWSPPCTTVLTEPHPQTVERWARHAEYLRTVAAADARRRN
jgi:hypothetical protein